MISIGEYLILAVMFGFRATDRKSGVMAIGAIYFFAMALFEALK